MSRKSNNRTNPSKATKQLSQLVVALSHAKKKKKSQKRLRGGSRPLGRMSNALLPSTNMYAKRYMLALQNPFHPDARGAKCTVFPYKNTVPYCVRFKILLTNPSLGSTNAAFFQPSPCFYGWTNVDNVSSGISGISTIQGQVSQIAANSAAGLNGAIVDLAGGTTPIVAGTLATYRVVAGGVKIRSIYQTNGGQYTATATPLMVQNSDLTYMDVSGGGPNTTYTKSTNGYWAVGGTGAQFVETLAFGQSITTSNGILGLPDCKSFTSYDVMQNSMTCRFTPLSPEAFEFKDIGADSPQIVNNNATNVGPFDLGDWNYTSNTAARGARRGNTDVAGFNGVHLTWINPAQTSNTGCFEVDYILHLEGQPKVMQTVMGIPDYIPAQDEAQVLTVARSLPQVFMEQSVSVLQNLGGRAVEWAGRRAYESLMAATGSMTRYDARSGYP